MSFHIVTVQEVDGEAEANAVALKQAAGTYGIPRARFVAVSLEGGVEGALREALTEASKDGDEALLVAIWQGESVTNPEADQ